MRSFRFALLLFAASAGCTTRQARRTDTTSPAAATLAGAPAGDGATVRQIIEANNARFAAAATRADTAVLVANYTDDAVVMWPNMPAARGRHAIAKGIASFLSTMKFTAFSLKTADVISAGDFAIETGTYEQSVQLKDGKSNHDVGKYLTIWQRQPTGGYKVARDISNTDLPQAK